MNHLVFYSVLFLGFLTVPGYAQEAGEAADSKNGEKVRKWHDLTGNFSVEAELIRIQVDQVVLKKKDGSEFTVPTTQLSPEDQRFLAKMGTPSTSLPGSSSTVAEQISVVIWLEAHGKSVPIPGFVMSQTNEGCLVLFKGEAVLSHRRYSGLFSDRQVPKIRVAFQNSDGSTTEYPAVLVARPDSRGYASVRIEGELATDSSLSTMPSADIHGGLAVRMIGFDIRSDSQNHSVARAIIQDASISRVFRDRAGGVTRFWVLGQFESPSAGAIIVDRSGRFVGVSAGQTYVRGRGIEGITREYLVTSTQLRLLGVSARLADRTDESFTFSIHGNYSNWNGTAVRVVVYPYSSSGRGVGQAYADGGYELLNDSEVNSKPNSFAGSVTVPRDAFDEERLVVQLETTDERVRVYSEPRHIRWNNPARVLASPSSSLPAKGTATSMVPVTEEEKKQLAVEQQWVREDAPQPKQTGLTLVGPEYDLTGLRVRALDLVDVLAPPVWSSGGKVLYACTRNGTISRIEFPSFTETHRLNLSLSEPLRLCSSKSGLAVLLATSGELLVLEEDNLRVQGRVRVGRAETLSGSPQSDYVYLNSRDMIQVVDLKKTRVVSRLAASISDPIRAASLSPNGEFLFVSRNDRIERYRTDGVHLMLVETSQQENPQRLRVCGNSEYVAVQLGTKLSRFDFHDLSTARATIQLGTFSKSFDCDPKSGEYYVHDRDHMLQIFDRHGMPRDQYRGISGDVRSLATHPAGGSLVASVNGRLIWIKIPESSKKENADGSFDDSAWLTHTAPQPTIVEDSLLTEKIDVNGCEAYQVGLAKKELVGAPIFAPSGRELFTVSAKGLVRAISVPDFTVTRQVDLAQSCTDVALSEAGLVVVVAGSDHLYILDTNTLTIQQRIKVFGAWRIAADSKTSLAFCLGPSSSSVLTGVDLSTGKIVSQYTGRALSLAARRLRPGSARVPGFLISLIKMAEGGKHLFTGSSEVTRYRIDEGQLVFEESTPAYAGNAQSLMVSLDSKWAALLTANHSGRTPDFPQIKQGTYIFDSMDLDKPHLAVETGPHPNALGIDPKNGDIYAQNSTEQLIVLTPQGEKTTSFQLPDLGRIETLLPSPIGSQVLVVGNDQSTWVELQPKR